MSELAEPVNARKTTTIKTLNILKHRVITRCANQCTEFAEQEGIDLSNPYYAGMSQLEINNINRILSEKYQLSASDKYDYAFAGIIGIVMGLVMFSWWEVSQMEIRIQQNKDGLVKRLIRAMKY